LSRFFVNCVALSVAPTCPRPRQPSREGIALYSVHIEFWRSTRLREWKGRGRTPEMRPVLRPSSVWPGGAIGIPPTWVKTLASRHRSASAARRLSDHNQAFLSYFTTNRASPTQSSIWLSLGAG
jgi:hypothetical protein